MPKAPKVPEPAPLPPAPPPAPPLPPPLPPAPPGDLSLTQAPGAAAYSADKSKAPTIKAKESERQMSRQLISGKTALNIPLNTGGTKGSRNLNIPT